MDEQPERTHESPQRGHLSLPARPTLAGQAIDGSERGREWAGLGERPER